jgi:hypothetical protein
MEWCRISESRLPTVSGALHITHALSKAPLALHEPDNALAVPMTYSKGEQSQGDSWGMVHGINFLQPKRMREHQFAGCL